MKTCWKLPTFVLLVGDSLGMVVQGHDSTVPVSLEEMIGSTRLIDNLELDVAA